MARPTAVVSVATRSHLHRARCLFDSVERHLPHADRYLVLADEPEDNPVGAHPFATLPVTGLPIPAVDTFVRRYTPAELSFAIKPYALAEMFERGYERALYLDSDVVAYSSLQPLVDALDDASIVVTPHRVTARERSLHDELVVLQAGTYNSGFIGVRRDAAATAFLQWWQQKLLRDCVVDVARGLCGDQRWLDVVPGRFDGVAIARDPGWNVGPWNLDERCIARSGGGFVVGERPLAFFHFSGFPAALTEPNIVVGNAHFTPALRELIAGYAQALDARGRAHYESLPFGFAPPPAGKLERLRRAGVALLRSVTPFPVRRRLRAVLARRAGQRATAA